MALVAAIVARDKGEVARLLDATPGLTTATAQVRATRGTPEPYFDEIHHYLYGGDTALHLAAAAHEPQIVQTLLAHGAAVGARNRRGAQPLHYAADGTPGTPPWNPSSRAVVVTVLIEAGADPNATDKSGVAPLHRAVRTRCAQAVRALLDGGADPGLPNKNGSTPLQLATTTTGRGGSGLDEAIAQQTAIVDLLTERSVTA